MGEFQHSIDEKGRLIIPSKFREELGNTFILAKGLDHCIFVYPMPEWSRVEERLRQLSFTHADARSFSRFFFSGAVESEMDKQGRVQLPPNLREYASLDRDVVTIGVSARMEIWNKQTWSTYSNQAQGDYELIAEKITDLNLGF